jgi:hypothetical protein
VLLVVHEMMQTVTENRGTGVLDARLSHALDAWSDTQLDTVFPPTRDEPSAGTHARHMRWADPDQRPVAPREHREPRHRRLIEPAPVDLGTWFDLAPARHVRD